MVRVTDVLLWVRVSDVLLWVRVSDVLLFESPWSTLVALWAYLVDQVNITHLSLVGGTRLLSSLIATLNWLWSIRIIQLFLCIYLSLTLVYLSLIFGSSLIFCHIMIFCHIVNSQNTDLSSNVSCVHVLWMCFYNQDDCYMWHSNLSKLFAKQPSSSEGCYVNVSVLFEVCDDVWG